MAHENGMPREEEVRGGGGVEGRRLNKQSVKMQFFSCIPPLRPACPLGLSKQQLEHGMFVQFLQFVLQSGSR